MIVKRPQSPRDTAVLETKSSVASWHKGNSASSPRVVVDEEMINSFHVSHSLLSVL